MADRRCGKPQTHEPHGWTDPRTRGFEWCPGEEPDVVVESAGLLDAGVPLEKTVETLITQLAITARQGNVELDWERASAVVRQTDYTLTTEQDRAKPIAALRISVPGQRRP